MSELANNLTEQTGISSDLVHQGLGALLNFLKKEVGDETFSKLTATIPGTRDFWRNSRHRPRQIRRLVASRHRPGRQALGEQGRGWRFPAGRALQARFHSRPNRGVHSQGHRVDQGLSSPRFARRKSWPWFPPCRRWRPLKWAKRNDRRSADKAERDSAGPTTRIDSCSPLAVMCSLAKRGTIPPNNPDEWIGMAKPTLIASSMAPIGGRMR